MTPIAAALTALFDRIPRRQTADNVKDINGILDEYEDLLQEIEAINPWFEKNTAAFFEELDTIKTGIKKSTDNKASKKSKDSFFDEASGALKDSMQALMAVYGEGNKPQ